MGRNRRDPYASGGTVSEMAIDPEFTDDGWVTWQEGEKLPIGT